MNADENAAAAVSKIAELRDEMRRVAGNRNEYEGILRKVDAKFAWRLIRLNTLFVELTRTDNVLRGVIEFSAGVLVVSLIGLAGG